MKKERSTKMDRESWEAYKQSKQYHIDKARQKEEDIESSFDEDDSDADYSKFDHSQ